jgi:hypothetical protein
LGTGIKKLTVSVICLVHLRILHKPLKAPKIYWENTRLLPGVRTSDAVHTGTAFLVRVLLQYWTLIVPAHFRYRTIKQIFLQEKQILGS